MHTDTTGFFVCVGAADASTFTHSLRFVGNTDRTGSSLSIQICLKYQFQILIELFAKDPFILLGAVPNIQSNILDY